MLFRSTDLASELQYPELADDARTVLETLLPAEKPIGCKDGRWFTVRIMPYRTVDDRIDGLVITFADISASRATAAKLGVKHASLEKRLANQTASMKKSRQGSRPAESKTAPASRPATRKRKTR